MPFIDVDEYLRGIRPRMAFSPETAAHMGELALYRAGDDVWTKFPLPVTEQ